MFGRLSLYPVDYYTYSDYDQLKDLIETNHLVGYVMLYVQLRDAPKDPISIAKSIENGERNINTPVENSIWHLMFNVKFENVPLYINDPYLAPIARWRLILNK